MASDLEILQEALAALYRFEHMLGRGGMATVYRAHDLRHDRPVAFKVLRRELSDALGLDRRFGREIAIAAQLAHPNILGVIDSGTISGPEGKLHYYVMPFVSGESLRERLEGNTQLPLEEALPLAAEAADALAHAHEAGVIHRDIKPGNILIQAGHALVADFGIAQMAAGAHDEAVTTSAGIVLGTPAYMSPEQSEGAPVDGRSDVYSLGCVLYEMLAGEPPYRGPNAQAVAARHRLDPAPSLRTARPDLPPEVDQIIHRALAKRPADRWKTAAAFREALLRLPTDLAASTGRREAVRTTRRGRWALGIGAMLAAAALALVILRPGRPAAEHTPMVVVDAFSDQTGGSLRAESEALRDALVEALQRAPMLRVQIGSADSAPAARWAVVGGIDRLGDSVVARARVVDLRDRSEVSVARTAAADAPTLLASAQAPAQSSLFSTVRRSLSSALLRDRRRMQVQDSAAWELAERGMALVRSVNAGAVLQAGPAWAVGQIGRGDSLLDQASRREPGSPALVAMRLDAADGAAMTAEQAAQVFPDSAPIGDPVSMRRTALPLGRTAVDRFPESADLQVALGRLLGNLYRANHDHALLEEGMASLTRATALDPTHAQAWLELGRLQLEAGLFGQALTSARTGRGADVFGVYDEELRRLEFEALLRLEQAVPARAACDDAQAQYPGGFYFADCREEVAQRFSDQAADAARALALADSLERTHADVGPQLAGKLRLVAATVLARAGDRAGSDSAWHRATRDWSPGRTVPTYLLLDGVYAQVERGATDDALRLLARAVRQDPTVPDIVEDLPWYTPLRGDPRYLLALRGIDPAEATAP